MAGLECHLCGRSVPRPGHDAGGATVAPLGALIPQRIMSTLAKDSLWLLRHTNRPASTSEHPTGGRQQSSEQQHEQPQQPLRIADVHCRSAHRWAHQATQPIRDDHRSIDAHEIAAAEAVPGHAERHRIDSRSDPAPREQQAKQHQRRRPTRSAASPPQPAPRRCTVATPQSGKAGRTASRSATCSTIEPKYTAVKVAAAIRTLNPIRTPQIGSSAISADSIHPEYRHDTNDERRACEHGQWAGAALLAETVHAIAGTEQRQLPPER